MSTHKSRSITHQHHKRRWFAAICLIVCLLSGCGGGISGTGDGGVVVVVTDTAPTTDQLGEHAAGIDVSIPDQSTDRLSYFPAPNTLATRTADLNALLLAADLSTTATDSATSLLIENLNQRLQRIDRASLEVSIDLDYLESGLLDALTVCNDVSCSDLPATVTVQQQSNSNTAASTAPLTIAQYRDIRFTRNLAGYFDNELYYDKADHYSATIRYTESNTLFYFHADGEDYSIYSLENRQNNTRSVRYLNKQNGALVQLAINTNESNSTRIEADLDPWYLRTRLSQSDVVLYANNRSNDTSRREKISEPPGDTTHVITQTCVTSNCVWQTEAQTNLPSTPDVIFSSTADTVGDFTRTDTADISLPFTTGAARFVVAGGSSGDQPLIGSIHCAGVDTSNGQRVFCWNPLPLDLTSEFYFLESLTNGLPTYLPLTVSRSR